MNIIYLEEFKKNKLAGQTLPLREKAEKLSSKGKSIDAARAYKELLEVDSTDVEALFGLGDILSTEILDNEGAIECYRRILVLDPTDARAAFSVGKCFLNSGEKEKALSSFELAKLNGHTEADKYLNQLEE